MIITQHLLIHHSCSLARLLARSLIHSLTHSSTRFLARSLTPSLTHSSTHPLACLLAHSLIHSLTCSLALSISLSTELPSITIITSSSTSEYVLLDSSVTLTCSAVGSEPLNLTWTLNGETVDSSDGVLTLDNTQLGQFGTYVCTASNALGMDQGQMDIFQAGKTERKVLHIKL